MSNKLTENYKAPRPKWAKGLLTMGHILTKGAVGYIAASQLFPPELKYEVTLVITLFLEPVLIFVTEMAGVKVKSKYQAVADKIDPDKSN